MKVFMTGGTGFVGSYLSKELAGQSHEVTVLTRREKPGVPAAPGIKIESAKEAALALGPLAGKWAFILFDLGLLNASLFSATILPLSTS
jgi:nucleoside-diphosphate-sugar epimerase